MKKIVLLMMGLGLAGFVPSVLAQVGMENRAPSDTKTRFSVDIAMDGRTSRLNHGITYEDAGRGDTFVIFGPIYRARTLPTGTASNSPDDPGSIGAWMFRGTFSYDGGVSRGSGGEWFGFPPVETPPLWIERRRGRPGVVDLYNQLGLGTGYFQFDGGATLVSEGPAGVPGTVGAVVGGMGAFSGARGEVTGLAIGTNSTGFPNLRLTFKLEK
jgi:hypothetical protein